jgi:hypothetical protein
MQANRKFTIRSIAGAQQKKAIAKSSCQAELVQEVPRHREILRLLHKANNTNPTARKGTATLQIGMWFRRKNCVLPVPGGFNTVVDHGCGPQNPLIDTRNPTDSACGAPGYRAFKHLIILTEENA